MLGADGNLVLNKLIISLGKAEMWTDHYNTLKKCCGERSMDSVGTSNPNLGANGEGFVEEETSLLRPIGQDGTKLEKKEGKKRDFQPAETTSHQWHGPGETVTYSLLTLHWLHQIKHQTVISRKFPPLYQTAWFSQHWSIDKYFYQ